MVGCKWGEMTDWSRELGEDYGGKRLGVGMRMGWQLSWRQVAVETALFPDRHAGRQTDTQGLTAECVNMKGV